MLETLSGLFSFFLESPKPEMLRSANWSPWLEAEWVQTLVQPQPDPVAEAIVQQHLKTLAASGFSAENQGIWLQTAAGGFAEHQGTVPLSAASLTKIATTLAALETWEIDHQFDTQIGIRGTVTDGTLQGDLVIQGGGDPMFVWEEAIALGNALQQAGIQRVTGDLVVSDHFMMNFEADPVTSGTLLKQGLNADRWPDEALTQYQTLPPETPQPQVEIAGTIRVGSVADAQPLIRHRSLPLVGILKAMNIYSNNVIAEQLATQIGGSEAVSQKVATAAKLPIAEVQLTNGSGLGMENRIAPKAVTAMLLETQRQLQEHNLSVADLYPVMGRDRGTLAGRDLPIAAAVKTGTLNEVSSLAGVIPTRDRGLVWFSIQNGGGGDLLFFHQQQDNLLKAVQQTWGIPEALPAEILPQRPLKSIDQLGAPDRNEILTSAG